MTFSDWDYINGNQNLDGSTYVSAPSSLRQSNTEYYQTLYAICKVGATTALVNARIVGWVRVWYIGTLDRPRLIFYFRFQNINNDYHLEISPEDGNWYFAKIVDGSGTLLGTQPLTFAVEANTWYKFRATLWESGGYVYGRLERWDAPNWVQQGSDIADTSPSFPGGGKVGVGMYMHDYGRAVWHDDTEIWG